MTPTALQQPAWVGLALAGDRPSRPITMQLEAIR
jgi:hypothetical protein